VKQRLEKLADRTKRSKSFLAAEAIAAYVDAEDWQRGEIAAGLSELDSGKMVEHEKVVNWLRSWGKPSESAPPR
jgi:predicted transcriptional regulator